MVEEMRETKRTLIRRRARQQFRHGLDCCRVSVRRGHQDLHIALTHEIAAEAGITFGAAVNVFCEGPKRSTSFRTLSVLFAYVRSRECLTRTHT